MPSMVPAAIGTITEYPVPTSGSVPTCITAGPDGNLWFTEFLGNKVAKATITGTITEYPVPTSGGGPSCITAGPDGNLWVTEDRGNKVAKVTTSGTFTEYPVPTPGSLGGGITTGPDGNLWITDSSFDKVAKMTTSGTFTEYPVPTSNSFPEGIMTGPDGNLWITEAAQVGPTGNVARVTTSGIITEYPVPLASGSIVTGPDGNLWITEAAGPPGKVAKVTTSGVVTEYSVSSGTGYPDGNASGPDSIATGPDGNVWFPEYSNGPAELIGKVTTSGSVTEYPVPTAFAGGINIAAGPDGNVWFTEGDGNKVAKILTPRPPDPPAGVDAAGDGTFGEVRVSWQPPAGGPPPESYSIRVEDMAGTVLSTATANPSIACTSNRCTVPIDHLSNCVSYQFQVASANSVGLSGYSGSVRTMPFGVKLLDAPSTGPINQPAYAVVIAEGVNTNISSASYQPLGPLGWPKSSSGLPKSPENYCAGPSGTDVLPAPLSDLITGWDNPLQTPLLTSEQPLNDALARQGAVILPFSYEGATLASGRAGPTSAVLNVTGYSAFQEAYTWPPAAADVMATEITTIHNVWPATFIVIVGHSNGGLIAELWWSKYETHVGNTSDNGVTSVYSLDSPVTGLQDASLCFSNFQSAALCTALQPFTGGSLVSAAYYDWAWRNRGDLDTQILNNDANEQYIPIGTFGDPVWDYADWPWNGMFSQLVFADNCSTLPTPNVCNAAGIDQGSQPECYGEGLTAFGNLGRDHGFVKNCPNVVNIIVCRMLRQAPPCVLPTAGPAGTRTLRPPRIRKIPSTTRTLPTIPPAYATASPSIVTAGQMVTITGSGLGASPGSVRFTSATGATSAGITGWSDSQVTASVPVDAVTGPVGVTTATGLPVLAGRITVLPPANGAASVTATQLGPTPFNGQVATVQVRAFDAQNQPLPNVTVDLSNGLAVATAQTDSAGAATFQVTGYGSRSFVAFSGSASTTLTLSWATPPRMSLSLTASPPFPPAGAPATIAALLTDAGNQPVAGQQVTFQILGSPTIQLSQPAVTTDGTGVARVTVTQTGSAPFIVEAFADDYAANGDIVVRPIRPIGVPAAVPTSPTVPRIGPPPPLPRTRPGPR